MGAKFAVTRGMAASRTSGAIATARRGSSSAGRRGRQSDAVEISNLVRLGDNHRPVS